MNADSLVTALFSMVLLVGGAASSPSEPADAPGADGVAPVEQAAEPVAQASAQATAESAAQSPADNGVVLEIAPEQPVVLEVPAIAPIAFSSSLATTSQVDTYTYTAPVAGTYRFELAEMMKGFKANVEVCDRLGQRVGKATGLTNGGVNVELAAGETYTVIIEGHTGTGAYDLLTYQQKPDVEVGDATVVVDAIDFANQDNRYLFTAEQDGTYRFELAEMMKGFEVTIDVENRLGQRVGATSFGAGNGEGLNVELAGGETYTVHVVERDGMGTFQLVIGRQRTTVDLDAAFADLGATRTYRVSDGLVFNRQVLCYRFVPQADGAYTFAFSEMSAGFKVNVEVLDHLGQTVAKSSSGLANGGTLTAELTAGETYTLQLEQREGTGTFLLVVGW